MEKVLLPDFNKRSVIVQVTEDGKEVEKVINGLVTVVAQDCQTGQILMVAYTNEAGYQETLRTGKAVYYSTSREKRWLKGETSGDIQLVRQILIDCDGDAIIYLVEQTGKGACHTGAWSCFFRDATTGEMIE